MEDTRHKEYSAIYLDDISTFPTEVIIILNALIDEERDFSESIKWWKKPAFDNLKLALVKQTFVFFHNTRVLEKNSIISKGLLPLDVDDYTQLISEAFKKIGLSESKMTEPLDLIKNELSRNGIYLGKLSFHAPLPTMQNNADYLMMAKCVGGERVQFALGSDYPCLLTELSKIGHAVTVEVFIQGCLLEELYLEGLSESLAGGYLKSLREEIPLYVDFDLNIEDSIPPNKIKKLHDIPESSLPYGDWELD